MPLSYQEPLDADLVGVLSKDPVLVLEGKLAPSWAPQSSQ